MKGDWIYQDNNMQTAPLYAESSDELVSAIRAAAIDLPSLGIIFSSVFLDIPVLSDSLAQFPYPIAGCSSSGEIMSGRGNNPVSELSATGCLINPDPDSLRVNLFNREEMSSYDLGRMTGTWGVEQFSNPVFIILISGLKTDGEQIIKGIESVFQKAPQVYGGMAADDGAFEQTYVFTNGRYSTDGILAIVFDQGTIEFSGLITSGWRGVGSERLVTRSSGNIVYTIDGKPALDLYSRYLHLKDEDIPRLSVDFPFIVKRTDGSAVIRTPTEKDLENRAIVFAGSVPEGSRVMFSSNPGEETIQNSIADITRFSDQIREADLLILFSCMARHQAVGRKVEDEINAAANAGTSLLIGFFSYGEIGNNELGRCEFYNETFTLLTIRQRRPQ